MVCSKNQQKTEKKRWGSIIKKTLEEASQVDDVQHKKNKDPTLKASSKKGKKVGTTRNLQNTKGD